MRSPARHGLDLAFDLFQNRAMHQQQLVRFGGAEDALGPAAETPLDGLLNFREEAHGWISPKFDGRVHHLGRDRSGGRTAVQTIFDQHRERDLAPPSPVRRKPDEPGVRRRVGQFRRAGLAGDRHARRAARRPVPRVTTSRMKRAQRGAPHPAADHGRRRLRAALVSSVTQRPCGIGAAVGDRGRHARHLERRRHHLPLPVRRLRQRLLQSAAVLGEAAAMPSRFAVSSSASAPTLYVPSCAK